MSTLKTHNLQSPDAGSVNIVMAPNAGMVVAGLSTYSNQINVGSNIKLGNAGVVTATSFVGSGANLTSLPTQLTLSNNADNRVITGGSGVNLNGEANLTFNGTTLDVTGNYSVKNPSDASYITHTFASNFAKIDVRGTNIANSNHYLIGYGAGHGSANDFHIVNTVGDLVLRNGNGNALEVDSNRNLKATAGNFVVGTAGKGIDFSAQTPTSATGASTTAEILDHYEEGSWTPVYLNVNTPTYGHQSGTYTRIGRAVHCQFQISVDSGLDTSDGSAVNIGGLPFAGNSAHESVVFSFGKLTNILSNARLAEVTNFRFGGTYIMLHRGSNYDINYTLCNSSGHLQAAFTYQMT